MREYVGSNSCVSNSLKCKRHSTKYFSISANVVRLTKVYARVYNARMIYVKDACIRSRFREV